MGQIAGKQAKIPIKQQLAAALRQAGRGRYGDRNRAIVLLSAKAGLRAGEIAKLTWPMVIDAQSRVASQIELHDAAAKKGRSRTIPIHPELARALGRLEQHDEMDGPVIKSKRGDALRPSSVVNWFARLYRNLQLDGCSSHSGRRTFITNAARLVFKAGGSLRDVQQLAGQRGGQGMREAITVREVLRLLWDTDCYPRMGNHDWVVGRAMEADALARPNLQHPPQTTHRNSRCGRQRCAIAISRSMSVRKYTGLFTIIFGAEGPGSRDG